MKGLWLIGCFIVAGAVSSLRAEPLTEVPVRRDKVGSPPQAIWDAVDAHTQGMHSEILEHLRRESKHTSHLRGPKDSVQVVVHELRNSRNVAVRYRVYWNPSSNAIPGGKSASFFPNSNRTVDLNLDGSVWVPPAPPPAPAVDPASCASTMAGVGYSGFNGSLGHSLGHGFGPPIIP